MLFTKFLTKVPRFSFGLVRTRNFYPTQAVFPEQTETPIYRPLYQKSKRDIIPPQRAFDKKLSAVVRRAKKVIKDRQPIIKKRTRGQQVKSEKPVNQEMKDFIDNLIVDDETGAIIGLGYDEFIKVVKAQHESKGQSQYIQNINKIIKNLNLMDQVQLADINKHFLAEKFKGDYLADAKLKLLKNLTNQIQQYKEQNKLDELLNTNVDLSKHNKEFVLSQIQEGKEDQIKNIFREELVSQTAKQIALDDINKKVREYRRIEGIIGTGQKRQVNPIKQALQEDPFFKDAPTMSDESDVERLIGERFERKPIGDEGFKDYQTIKNDETIKLMKRNYFRNKVQYSLDKNILTNQKDIETKDVNLQTFLQIDEAEADLHEDIHSINESAYEKMSFEEIYERIDYFLKEAPNFIKEACANTKECDDKPFYPRSLTLELKQRDLLWDNFSRNFQTVFPLLTDNETRERLTVTTDKKVLKQEEEYSIELFNQMQQPQNEQFFRHYLVNSMKFFNMENEHRVQQLVEGIIPTYLKEDYVKFMEFQDNDVMKEETDEDDPELHQMQESSMDEAQRQFLEAANLPFFGKGKRKTSRAAAKIQKGYGKVTINGKPVQEYFLSPYYRRLAMIPMDYSGLACYLDIDIWVRGSGLSAQADAIANALSRAIISMIPALKRYYRKLNLTKTDPRMVERKKTGLLKARKKWPYNRR